MFLLNNFKYCPGDDIKLLDFDYILITFSQHFHKIFTTFSQHVHNRFLPFRGASVLMYHP